MEMIIASLAMLSIAFIAVGLIVRNQRMKIRMDKRMKVSSCVQLSAVILVFTDMAASGVSISLAGVVAELLPSAVALWLMASTMSDLKFIRFGKEVVLLMNPCILTFHVYRMLIDTMAPSRKLLVLMISAMTALLVIFFMLGIFFRMRNVKGLMKNGTVWAVVTLAVDVVYMSFIIIGAAFTQTGLTDLGVLLVGGVVSGVGARIMTDSKFIVWQKQENLIIETIKLTSLPSASDASNINDVYKELYDRIVMYFEERKPYLDSELTINDLVKDLYSNKLYISKAISQFTGRNFCQFVNYYRVKHSMKCFRENQELKIHELATMNGFNTIVSYSMAFRLFMGETPSEWCRKEKSRLIKKGK